MCPSVHLSSLRQGLGSGPIHLSVIGPGEKHEASAEPPGLWAPELCFSVGRVAVISGSGWGQASLVLVPGAPELGKPSQLHLLFLAVSLFPGFWKLVKSARLKKESTWAKPCWRMVLSTMVSGAGQVDQG